MANLKFYDQTGTRLFYTNAIRKKHVCVVSGNPVHK